MLIPSCILLTLLCYSEANHLQAPLISVQPLNQFVIQTWVNNEEHNLSISCETLPLSDIVHVYNWYYIELTDEDLCVEPDLSKAQLVNESSQYSIVYEGNKSSLLFNSVLSSRAHYCVAYNKYGAVRSEMSFFKVVYFTPFRFLSSLKSFNGNSVIFACSELQNGIKTHDVLYDWGLNLSWYRLLKGIKYSIKDNDRNAKMYGPLLVITSLSQETVGTRYLCEVYDKDRTMQMLYSQESKNVHNNANRIAVKSLAYIKGRPFKPPAEVSQFQSSTNIQYKTVKIIEGEPLTLYCLFGKWSASSQLVAQSLQGKYNDSEQSLEFVEFRTNLVSFNCSSSSQTNSISILTVRARKLATLYSPRVVDEYLPENRAANISLICGYQGINDRSAGELFWFKNNSRISSNSSEISILSYRSFSRIIIHGNSYLNYNNQIVQCYYSYCHADQLLYTTNLKDRAISTFRLIGQSLQPIQKLVVDFLPQREIYVVNPDYEYPFLIVMTSFARTVPRKLLKVVNIVCKIEACYTKPCPIYLAMIDNSSMSSLIYAMSVNASLDHDYQQYVNLNLSCSGTIRNDRFFYSSIIRTILCHNCSEHVSVQDKSTLKLAKVVYTPIKNSQLAMETAENIENLTSNGSMLRPLDVSLAVLGFGNLLTNRSITTRISRPLLASFNNLLKVDFETFQKSQTLHSSGQQFFNQIDKFSMDLDVENSDATVVLSQPEISIAAVVLKNEIRENFIGFQSNVLSGESQIVFLDDHYAHQTKPDENMIRILVDKSYVIGQRLTFHYLKNDMLTQILQSNEEDSSIPLTPLIAAQTELNNTEQEFPIHVIANHQALNKSSRVQCAYWNTTDLKWSTDGCNASKINSARSETLCLCNHLTNFAILVSYHDVSINLNKDDNRVLGILSIINLILSSIGLALTVVIYSAYHQHVYLHQKNINYQHSVLTTIRVVISFSMTLILGNVIFLTTSQYKQNDSICKAIAILHHYLYLSVFCWSVVQAFLLVNNIVIVALREKSIMAFHVAHVFLKSAMFAWGLPLIIVIITLSLNSTNYYGIFELFGENEIYSICFLVNRNTRIIAFILPCGIMLLADYIAFILVVFVLVKYNKNKFVASGSDKFTERQKQQRKQTIKGLLGLVFMLSLVWLTALIQVNIVTQYIFVLSTTLQGCFIFLFYCLLKKDVQKYIRDNSSLSIILSKMSSTSVSLPAGGGNSIRVMFSKSSNSTKFYLDSETRGTEKSSDST